MGVPLLVLVPLEGGHTLEYKIKTISSKEEIVNCNRFEIDHVQWHHAITPPKACGYMGYLRGEGLYVQICTEEHDPLARCTEHHEMVCKDSLDYAVGDTVRHIKFGVGIVEKIEDGGRDYEVTVNFEKCGVKKMFAAFAKLKKL